MRNGYLHSHQNTALVNVDSGVGLKSFSNDYLKSDFKKCFSGCGYRVSSDRAIIYFLKYKKKIIAVVGVSL